MPHFEKLPREVRDMIYTYAMISNGILLAKGEDIQKYWLESPLSLPLLEVSRKVSKEALEIFYAINMFQISPYPVLGKPSVFVKHAKLFRSVRLVFDDSWLDEYGPLKDPWTKDGFVDIWKKQIRTLLPMHGLRTLWLDINSLMYTFTRDIRVIQRAITDELMPELLASLPLEFRGNAESRSGAIWISADPFVLPSPDQVSAILKTWKNSVIDVSTTIERSPLDTICDVMAPAGFGKLNR